jgi:hypothetical protein
MPLPFFQVGWQIKHPALPRVIVEVQLTKLRQQILALLHGPRLIADPAAQYGDYDQHCSDAEAKPTAQRCQGHGRLPNRPRLGNETIKAPVT